MFLCSLAIAVPLSPAGPPLELLEPLRQAIEARRRIRTAVAEMMWTRPDGVPVFYTVRLAPEAAAWFNWGDRAGVVGDDPDREGRPHSVLREQARLWSYDHDRRFAELYSTRGVWGENVPDLRSLGLMFFTAYEDPESTIRRIERAGVESFEVGRQGSLQIVTAHTRQGEVTWWIDPAKDSQPVRVELRRDGRLAREARIELEQSDGIWFPMRIETVSYGPDGREQSHDVIEVFYSEFNRPEHLQNLTPTDIGLEPGVLVTRHPSKKGDEALVWDGRGLVPFSQYRGRFPHEPDGEPPAVAPREDLSFDGQVRHALSAWEQYTRDFIARHRLDRARAGRAWRWLRECQRYANRKVDTCRRDLGRLSRSSGGSSAAVGERQQRIARLRTELDRIFEQRLKPGLKKLLTRAERRVEEQFEKRHRSTGRSAGSP